MRVLIVEDDPAVSQPLRKALEREGYQPRVCPRGEEALELAEVWLPDLVLLDLQLPDMDGRDIMKRLRAFTSVPIIMVTGRAEVGERVEGLDAGASDYIVKPFHPEELLARIRAVMRSRSEPVLAGSVLAFRDLTLDLTLRKVSRSGIDLGVTAKEFELLRLLVTRAGAIVRRDQLVRAIWGVSLAEGAGTLDVHLSLLRRKLGDDPKAPRYIESIRGIGLRFVV